MIQPYYQNPQTTVYCGDNEEILPELPEQSVDMIMTSPPYYNTRKYRIPDKVFDNHNGCEHIWESAGYKNSHPDRCTNGNGEFSDRIPRGTQPGHAARGDAIYFGSFCTECRAWKGQLGLEPTPDLYIQHLCNIFDLCKRVLIKSGALWVNIADTYAGSGSGWSKKPCKQGRNPGSWGVNEDTIFTRPPNYISSKQFNGLTPKSLIGIPARFQLEMIRRGWICRNVIIWHKRNCMPASVHDRFTVDFEYLFFFTLREKYFFEQQFEQQTGNAHSRGSESGSLAYQIDRGSFIGWKSPAVVLQTGRNKRSVWSLSSYGVRNFNGKHYATFPRELCTIPIQATCPEFICVKCGKPRIKLYERSGGTTGQSWVDHKDNLEKGLSQPKPYFSNIHHLESSGQIDPYRIVDKGYSDCNCNAGWRPGLAMDIFGGSGTVAVEARNLRRQAIVIDIGEDYCRQTAERIETGR